MRSPLLALYLVTIASAVPLARILLRRRLARGKEDPARLPERLGIASAPRPDGTLLWFHAASVGESLSILELIARLGAARPGLGILVTTGTVTSAAVLARRLPAGAIHQFAPVDLLPALRRFLAHWQPALAIRVESELWPATLAETHRAGIPIVIVNGRLSERTARGWRWAPLMIRSLTGRIAAVYAQDEASGARFRRLGAPVVLVTGTLKEGSAPLPHDETERQRLAGLFEGRPLWLAASTHAGEEEPVAEAHRAVRRLNPQAVLVLVPRHPERGPAIAAALAAAGWHVARRGAGERPGTATDIYLADTLGEMGLWYRLAPVAFIGGSLVPVGGHNPFEPAALGSAVIHGPFVENFADGYLRLGQAKAAKLVRGAEELAQAVSATLSPEESARMAAAAWDIVSAGAAVTDRVVGALLPLLPEAR
jgi:3-deoxy-D-manno-octulosonic-acid transferase